MTMMVMMMKGRLLAEPGVVLVGDLGRTQRTKLAVLRRELDVRRKRVRWKNLPTGSVVGRRWHYPVVRLVRCLRHKHRRPPINVPLGGVNILLRQQRPRRTSQWRIRTRLMLSVDGRSPRRTSPRAGGRILGVGMGWSRYNGCSSHVALVHTLVGRRGSCCSRCCRRGR